MKSKQERKFSILLKNISLQLNIEKSSILYFLNNSLEKIYEEKLQVPLLKLKELESQFEILSQRETDLKNEAIKITELIDNVNKNIERQNLLITEKSTVLTQKQEDLNSLTKKINEIKADIQLAEKNIKQTNYNILVKNSSLKEKVNKDSKYNALILTIFSLIGIIIALLIIKHT